ncbi:deAMPylase SidD family protein [uncultured Legionella sp.]|uniref:deAMPylase SidD family protein n=1 Tax=uncultured Legionella sp. TaxID=210934 RepID=UPI00262E5CC5|nr:deAMPylase SidD family protein [uncultured Legionella sp.]
MRLFISQSCHGVRSGQAYRSIPNRIDNGNSSIFVSSLFIHLDECGNDVAKAKDTDDQVIIGYTKDGMAFQIIVDGFFGGDREAVFAFVSNHVVSLMEQYSNDLGTKEEPDVVTELLIKSIYSLRKKHAVRAEFTMSLAITYQRNDALFCAGFGIGDTGIVIKRAANGVIEQLVAHTEVDGFKDAFDSYSQSDIDLVIRRNTVFNTKVMPGDELVGYTYLQPELERLVDTIETGSLNKVGSKQSVKHLALASEFFNNHSSLFSQLLAIVEERQSELIVRAKKAEANQKFGDDFAVGSLIIPDKLFSHQLRCNSVSIAIEHALISFERKIESESRWFFDLFSGLNRTLEQAQLYKNLLVKYQADCLISLIIIQTMLNSKVEKQMNHCLIGHFDCSQEEVFDMLDELIRKEINYRAKERQELSEVLPHLILELKTDIQQFINNPKRNDIHEVLEQFLATAISRSQVKLM